MESKAGIKEKTNFTLAQYFLLIPLMVSVAVLLSSIDLTLQIISGISCLILAYFWQSSEHKGFKNANKLLIPWFNHPLQKMYERKWLILFYVTIFILCKISYFWRINSRFGPLDPVIVIMFWWRIIVLNGGFKKFWKS